MREMSISTRREQIKKFNDILKELYAKMDGVNKNIFNQTAHKCGDNPNTINFKKLMQKYQLPAPEDMRLLNITVNYPLTDKPHIRTPHSLVKLIDDIINERNGRGYDKSKRDYK